MYYNNAFRKERNYKSQKYSQSALAGFHKIQKRTFSKIDKLGPSRIEWVVVVPPQWHFKYCFRIEKWTRRECEQLQKQDHFPG